MLENTFFAKLEKMRAVIADKENPAKHFDKIMELISDADVCRHFIIEVDLPYWLKPLADKGIFTNPPEPKKSGDGVAHPDWPASIYLAKMAPLVPAEVFEILKNVKTTNARIIADICDAALTMPIEYSRPLSVLVQKALKDKVWPIIYADKAAKLVIQLGKDNIDAAIQLAQVLFAVEPRQSTFKEPIGNIDSYQYGKLLPQVVEDLAKINAIKTMEWLTELLKQATMCKLTDPQKRWDIIDDVSYIWRPKVEEAEDFGEDILDSIVNSLRDLSEYLVREKQWPLEEAVSFLENKKILILSRIALNLIRLFASNNMKLALAKMLDFDKLEQVPFRHEYATLLKGCFASLSQEEQHIILNKIDAGPEEDRIRKLLVANSEKEVTDENVHKSIKYWQRDRLSWFEESLPPEWKPRYKALVDELGKPDMADVSFRMTSSCEETSSHKSGIELAAMPTAEMVDYLNNWKSDGKEYLDMSLSNLSYQFGIAVQQNLNKYSQDAAELISLPNDYVKRFLREITTAVQNKQAQEIAIEPILDLCVAVATRCEKRLEVKTTVVGREHKPEDLNCTCDSEIVDLIVNLCDQDISLQFRAKIWQCLSATEMLPDKNYYQEDENSDARLSVWLTAACNNPKAQWIRAVIRYAVWVKRQIISTKSQDEEAIGIEVVPEASEIIGKYLSLVNNLSPSIWAEYGHNYTAICWLDRNFAQDIADSVFSLTGEHEKHGWAAWNTYLICSHVYEGVFNLLRQKYEYAVDKLEPSLNLKKETMNPLQRLAEHLVVLCGRGNLSVEEENGILFRFFHKASPEICAHAIKTVGRSLQGDFQNKEVIGRFVDLWEWFWQETADKRELMKESLTAFGWWMTCDKFDDEWCLKYLIQITEFQPKINPDHKVMEKLLAMTRNYPLEVIKCVDSMVRGYEEEWKVYDWKEQLKCIFEIIVQSGNLRAKEISVKLIDYLGRRGFLDFETVSKSFGV